MLAHVVLTAAESNLRYKGELAKILLVVGSPGAGPGAVHTFVIV